MGLLNGQQGLIVHIIVFGHIRVSQLFSKKGVTSPWKYNATCTFACAWVCSYLIFHQRLSQSEKKSILQDYVFFLQCNERLCSVYGTDFVWSIHTEATGNEKY